MKHTLGPTTGELSLVRKPSTLVLALRVNDGDHVLDIEVEVTPEKFGRVLHDPDWSQDVDVSGTVEIDEEPEHAPDANAEEAP